MGEGFPATGRGRAVGLLGGSFDPPHQGHVAITRAALTRFGLDQVWWVVSPGNPLKPHGPAPLAERLAAARALIRHPRVTVSDVEARLGTRYTADTLAALQRRYPGVRFVWLMGADNLVQLPQWDGWRRIMDSVPLGDPRPAGPAACRAAVAAGPALSPRADPGAGVAQRWPGPIRRPGASSTCRCRRCPPPLAREPVTGRGPRRR